MKQVLAMNYAVIEAEEIMIINHPTTIFTNDDVPVSVYESLIDANVTLPNGDVPWNRYWKQL